MNYKLPPLPETGYMMGGKGYSGAQMQAYAIAAIEAQGVPDGWQLVPKQPTHEMERAGWKELPWVGAASCDRGLALTRLVYAKMLASSPPAPQAKPQPLSSDRDERIAELERELAEVRKDAERWRTFLSTRPQATHEVINQAIDDAAMKGQQ